MARVRPKPLALNVVPKSSKVLLKIVGLISMIGTTLGIIPMKIDGEDMQFSFKLFSWRSLFSFVRLVVFNAPLTIAPLVLFRGGFVEQEIENELDLNMTDILTNDPYANDMVQVILNLLNASCFLYYVLPFILCCKIATPMANINKTVLKTDSHQVDHILCPSYMILLPIFCFLFIAIGNLTMALAFLDVKEKTYPGSSSLLFTNIVVFGQGFTSQLGLNFFLVVYEFFFYHVFYLLENFTKYVLATKNTALTLSRTNDLVFILANFQEAYGWFLLVDLSLLLFFWLSHWYIAFINIKVSTLAVAGPVLVILAEMLRVIGISSACERITNNALEVAMAVEGLKTDLVDEKEIKVRKLKQPLMCRCVTC